MAARVTVRSSPSGDCHRAICRRAHRGDVRRPAVPGGRPLSHCCWVLTANAAADPVTITATASEQLLEAWCSAGAGQVAAATSPSTSGRAGILRPSLGGGRAVDSGGWRCGGLLPSRHVRRRCDPGQPPAVTVSPVSHGGRHETISTCREPFGVETRPSAAPGRRG